MSDKDKGPLAEEVKQDPAQTIPPVSILLEQENYANFGDTPVNYLKNIAYSTPLVLTDLVDYAQGQVTSKTLVQNSHLGITVFAMSAGEGISAHKSTGDAFVTVLEGCGKITIDENNYELKQGQCIVMPAGHPHAVHAKEDFKMLLVVVFPPND